MGKRLLASLALAPLLAAAGEFVYLTPSDLGGRKIFEGSLDQWNFEKEAPGITAYASEAPLPPVLRDSLRAMGAAVLKRVAFDPADAPDHFRYRAGFQAAFGIECDGVYLPEGDRLSASYRKALDAAKEDAAMVARLKDLAAKLYGSDDLIRRVEGRRAVKWLMDTAGCRDLSADFLRLEVGAWIYRLEAVLGVAHEPAPKESGSLGPMPEPSIPKGIPEVKMAMRVRDAVKLDRDGRVSATYDGGRFDISVREPEGECRLEITMAPGTRRKMGYGYFVGAFPKSHAPAKLPPEAPFSAPWEIMNGKEARFSVTRPHGVVRHDAFSPAYPDPELSWRSIADKETKAVTYRFGGSCAWFGPLAPMAEERRVDRWRVVVKDAKGTLCDALLVWPAGSADCAKRYLGNLAGRDLAKTWDLAVNGAMNERGSFTTRGLRQRYAMSSYEKGFGFFETKDRCFEIGDVKSDELFWTAYAKVFWGRKPSAERLATLRHDVLNARREYLKACYAGGPFKKPVADRGGGRSGVSAAKAPDADLGALDSITLEDD